MDKLLEKNSALTFGLLVVLTISLAVVGIAAEVIFVASHLEIIARQVSLLTIGGTPN